MSYKRDRLMIRRMRSDGYVKKRGRYGVYYYNPRTKIVRYKKGGKWIWKDKFR